MLEKTQKEHEEEEGTRAAERSREMNTEKHTLTRQAKMEVPGYRGASHLNATVRWVGRRKRETKKWTQSEFQNDKVLKAPF